MKFPVSQQNFHMETVAYNLVHQQLWTKVRTFAEEDYEFCHGKPPKKMHPDDPKILEDYVLVSYTKDTWSVKDWANAFAILKRAESLSEEPKRIIMAMITDDSTVVYYLIHNGLMKPKKN